MESAKWGLDSEDVIFAVAALAKSPKPRVCDSTQIPNLSPVRLTKNLFPSRPDFAALPLSVEGAVQSQGFENACETRDGRILAIQSSSCHTGDTKPSIRKNLARYHTKK